MSVEFRQTVLIRGDRMKAKTSELRRRLFGLGKTCDVAGGSESPSGPI
jgi:hypothetical protein